MSGSLGTNCPKVAPNCTKVYNYTKVYNSIFFLNNSVSFARCVNLWNHEYHQDTELLLYSPNILHDFFQSTLSLVFCKQPVFCYFFGTFFRFYGDRICFIFLMTFLTQHNNLEISPRCYETQCFPSFCGWAVY